MTGGRMSTMPRGSRDGSWALIIVGLRGTLRSIDRVLFPTGSPDLVQVLRDRRRRRRGLDTVALGGGTGLATLLRGLKHYTSNLSAVVTVFDDGGSSGRLRRELGILPPGDIRHCLVALAEAEPLMTRLFEYRFQGGALTARSATCSSRAWPGSRVTELREGDQQGPNIRGRGCRPRRDVAGCRVRRRARRRGRINHRARAASNEVPAVASVLLPGA
jgi:hypothetical protein